MKQPKIASKYANEYQNWLGLSKFILVLVFFAKHSLTKYTPFHMVDKRDHIMPFQLADNHRDGNAMSPNLSGCP